MPKAVLFQVVNKFVRHEKGPNQYGPGLIKLEVMSQAVGLAKVALKLQVAPLKDGVANAATQGLGPLLELLASRGVASDKTLVDAVGAHQAPLVVVAAQPNLGDVLETLVLPNLLGRNVAVIVDDGHALGKVVEQLLTGLGAQQEILIVHKVFHQTAPLLATRAHGALVIL